jgi:hypothetical protein
MPMWSNNQKNYRDELISLLAVQMNKLTKMLSKFDLGFEYQNTKKAVERINSELEDIKQRKDSHQN